MTVQSTQTDLDPEFAAMIEAVEAFRTNWPTLWSGPGAVAPHAVAHQDPASGMVTFHLRGLPEQFDHLCAGLAAIAAADQGKDPDLMNRDELVAEVLALRGVLAARTEDGAR